MKKSRNSENTKRKENVGLLKTFQFVAFSEKEKEKEKRDELKLNQKSKKGQSKSYIQVTQCFAKHKRTEDEQNCIAKRKGFNENHKLFF